MAKKKQTEEKGRPGRKSAWSDAARLRIVETGIKKLEKRGTLAPYLASLTPSVPISNFYAWKRSYEQGALKDVAKATKKKGARKKKAAAAPETAAE